MQGHGRLCDDRLMAARLSSKVVIVTGGSTGIGRAVADRVVAEGGAVVIAGRRREPGERAAAELCASGGRARFVATDVTVEHEVQRLVEAAVDEFGRLDGALNNAGGVNATAPLPGVDAGTWHADLAQNLTSVFYCLKYQIPAMTESAGGGSIINNASIGGVRGMPGLAPYAAATERRFITAAVSETRIEWNTSMSRMNDRSTTAPMK